MNERPLDETPRNLLASEKSPYLLQHASNPVAWRAWNDETLALAKKLDRPIFLSVGYATCHWCHVMEHESFEDQETADVLNELFVNVKVDREERPDVDQIYMRSVMALHGQGGWPLSVWLTPDLKPFYGGTYFPKTPRYGRPGFKDVCRTLADLFARRRADVEAQAAQAVEVLNRRAGGAASADALAALPSAAARALLMEFDREHGGFGEAPKFPRPCTLDLLSREIAHEGPAAAAARVATATTLDRMYRGGLYDHVGGGFARYSTDARWLVPHFEKMLYDNAQLIDAYVDGALLLGRPEFFDVAEDVAAWVLREMTSPEGGFYSAQDADSEGEEGKFYVFTLDELKDALGDDAAFASRVFGATSLGNFEGSNVLHLVEPIDALAEKEGDSVERFRARLRDVRTRLYERREGRPRPLLDDKVLASWNGMMIAAFARLGVLRRRRDLVDAARKASDFVRARLWRSEERVLLRRYREGDARFVGSLDDYAHVALGELALFEATGEASRLSFAKELMARAEEIFPDEVGGGYFFAAEATDLVARLKEAYDGATPSANSTAARAHARLGAILGDETERDKARATVRAFSEEALRHPAGYPALAAVADDLARPPRRLEIVADHADAAFDDLVAKAHDAFAPGRAIVPILGSERAALAALGVAVEGKVPKGGRPTAFLCEDLACREWP
jgi:uncharacterized protein